MNATLLRCAIISAFFCAIANAGAESTPVIDAKVRQVLDSMSAFYKGLNTANCDYAIEVTREAGGKKDSAKLDFTVAAERPNKISFVQGESTGGIDVVSDGKVLAVYIPQLKKYVIEAAPDSIAAALEWGALTTLTEFNSIIGELMGLDPAGAILDGVSEANYVGEEDFAGHTFHRIRLVQEEMDVDIWIATGDKPYMTRLVPDVSKALGDADAKVTLNVSLAGWTGNAAIPNERFAFKAPDGAEKAESFEALFGQSEKYPSDALIGSRAPTFNLKGLDGKPIDLGTYLGKNIVVLDFWATWCGPCVMSLPILSEITGSYKDKGVVFIAVNQGEGPGEINEFLKAQKLTLNVALDTDMSVAQQYFVDGIPQSVLIGKSGTVEAVHVGASPILRQQLRSQLSSLVAGKSLVK